MQRERSLRALEQEALDSGALESNCSSMNGDQLIESSPFILTISIHQLCEFHFCRGQKLQQPLLYNYRNAKAIQSK